MHMMLVARCLERIGDNAVDIGEQTAFVVTGLFREFEDASHPELAPHPARLIRACIDIGSNTTRLLVADAGSGRLRELVNQRAFTRIGKSLAQRRRDDPGGEDRGDRRRRAHAGHRGARGRRRAARGRGHRRDPPGRRTATSCATPWPRPAGWSSTCSRARRRRGWPSLAPRAPCSSRPTARSPSSTWAAGRARSPSARPTATIGWSASFRIGSGFLADAYLRSRSAIGGRARESAPSRGGRVRGPRAAAGRLARWRWAGTATSLRRLVGAELAHETLERGIRVLSSTPIA